MKRNNQTNEKALAHARGATPETVHPATEPVCGFGRKRMPYSAVMECMAGTPVYSVRTSSLPLAQLMRPSPDLDRLLGFVETVLDVEGPEPERFGRFLEYPTWPRGPATGRAIGRPSMSDAMLLGAHLRIAVEGKWTEPHFGAYQTVEDWLREGRANGRSRRPDVLEAWIAEVRAAGALRRGVTPESLAGVPYQLVHRTASACHRAGCAPRRRRASRTPSSAGGPTGSIRPASRSSSSPPRSSARPRRALPRRRRGSSAPSGRAPTPTGSTGTASG